MSEDIVPADKIVLEMLQDMQLELSRLRRGTLRETNQRSPSDCLSAIANALYQYRTENPGCVLPDLIGSKAFYHEMERLAEAPKYFRGPGEFYEAVDDFLSQAIKFEDRKK